MAIGPIEMSTIVRAQDFTTIKQNEDQKSFIDQSNLQQQFDKTVKDRPHQVSQQENADFMNRKFDAKDKGDNEYARDGEKQKRQKKEEDGRVIIKGQAGFDIKI